jgi:hypothetical protein
MNGEGGCRAVLQQVAVDVQQRAAVVALVDDMRAPDFFEQRLTHGPGMLTALD